ncbi:MAG: amidohydrolase [Spirochaetaceae bacterium]|nr:MAG: amidohydrolase [Spirochaetaceae bacterium]
MKIRAEILDLTDELIHIRRDLHMHPELGFQEFRTADFVERYLRDLGLEPQRLAETGVVATMAGTARGSSDGPVIMLRADMDALPVQEENDIPYKSLNDGIMHACAHDGHTAMLLVAAKVLSGMRDRIRGKVKFLFQPNEEVAGAEIMCEAGAMENPRVNAALGLHLWTPLPSGTIGASSGGVMASLDVFRIVVRGKGGHTGYPDSAVDPVIAAADLIQTAQRIQTRDISLLNPTALIFSKINSGTKSNIIPDEVEIEGTLRYLYEPTEEINPSKRLEEVVQSVCAVHKCDYRFEIHTENEVVVNAPEMVTLVREAATEILDGSGSIVEHRSMAGEDFAAYAKHVPAAFVFLGTRNAEAGSDYPHHSPRFNIDEETLPVGVELLVRTTELFFDHGFTGTIP